MTRTMTSRLPGILALLLATPLCACEIDKQLDPDGLADGSSSAASTGDDGEMSGTGVGPTSAGSSVSATSASATGGEDTSGGEFSCAPGTALLALEIDDVQSATLYEPGGGSSSSIGTEIWLADEGAVSVRAEQSGDGPSSVQGEGYVRLPPDLDTDPGSWFCFDETSTLVDDGDDVITLEMNGLARLGPCPGGVAVEGTITACFRDPSCGGGWSVEGMLGQDLLQESMGGYRSYNSGGGQVVAIDVGGEPVASGGQIGFRVGAIDGDGGLQVLPLQRTYFVVPVEQPDGGAVYCAGDGSSATFDGDSIVSVELVGLTRLGSCADGEATGSGMYCSDLGG